MSPSGPNPYLKTKIMTASPQELRLMLYEGAIKFCRQARAALDADERENAYNALMRAQKIVLELSTSLNHDAAPDLCAKLSALYTYIYRLLVDANIEHIPAKVDEATKLLEYEKETWQLLIERVAAGESEADAADAMGARQTAISSLSQSA
jgi:flagellar secretion chaperone FliS